MAKRVPSADGAVAVTDNQHRFSFPPELADATKAAYTHFQRLMAERRTIAARMRDVVQDAKLHGYPTLTVRTGHKLERMTPEKREKWLKEMESAAALFGVQGFQFAEEDKRDPGLWGFIERARGIWHEKRELAETLEDLRETAIEAGVDYDGLRLIHSGYAKLEGEAKEDKFHRLDKLGAFLGFW